MLRRLHSNPPQGNNSHFTGYVAPVDRRTLVEKITPQERERIARIAATIPDRVPKVSPQWDYGERLRDCVLEHAQISKQVWMADVRRDRAAAVAAGIAYALREKNADFFSYPKIARILGKKDHTTIIHAVRRWPYFAAQYPDIAQACQKARSVVL
jgi:chromosomal replication initiation ATPase DnaA